MKAQVKSIVVTEPRYEVTLALTMEEALDLQDCLGQVSIQMFNGISGRFYNTLGAQGISSRKCGGHRAVGSAY